MKISGPNFLPSEWPGFLALLWLVWVGGVWTLNSRSDWLLDLLVLCPGWVYWPSVEKSDCTVRERPAPPAPRRRVAVTSAAWSVTNIWINLTNQIANDGIWRLRWDFFFSFFFTILKKQLCQLLLNYFNHQNNENMNRINVFQRI